MTKIDSRSAQVHFLFEGLLSGDITAFTPAQRDIILFAMTKTYPGLKARQKANEKATKVLVETPRRSYNQEGRQGKQRAEMPLKESGSRVVYRVKQVCFLLMFLLAVVLGYSLYVQFF